MNKPYITNLIFFGDSFVAGTIKDDDGFSNTEEDQKRIRFSTHVANKLKTDFKKIPTFCENRARAGNSNEGILHDIIKHLDETEGNYIVPEQTFVFVAWSSLIRFGKYDKKLDEITTVVVPENEIHYVDTCLKSFSSIMAAYQILKSRGYNFLFSSSFTDFDQHYIFDKYIKEDIKNIWWHYGENNNNLYDMVSENKFNFTKRWILNDHKSFSNDHPNLSKCFHPNANGHKLIAKNLLDYLQNNYSFKLKDGI